MNKLIDQINIQRKSFNLNKDEIKIINNFRKFFNNLFNNEEIINKEKALSEMNNAIINNLNKTNKYKLFSNDFEFYNNIISLNTDNILKKLKNNNYLDLLNKLITFNNLLEKIKSNGLFYENKFDKLNLLLSKKNIKKYINIKGFIDFKITTLTDNYLYGETSYYHFYFTLEKSNCIIKYSFKIATNNRCVNLEETNSMFYPKINEWSKIINYLNKQGLNAKINNTENNKKELIVYV